VGVRPEEDEAEVLAGGVVEEGLVCEGVEEDGAVEEGVCLGKVGFLFFEQAIGIRNNIKVVIFKSLFNFFFMFDFL
jgi:hypothetical protein